MNAKPELNVNAKDGKFRFVAFTLTSYVIDITNGHIFY